MLLFFLSPIDLIENSRVWISAYANAVAIEASAGNNLISTLYWRGIIKINDREGSSAVHIGTIDGNPSWSNLSR